MNKMVNRLKPGEEWDGEFVIRHHEGIWDEPVFGYQGPVPPPRISTIPFPKRSNISKY